MLLGCPGHGSRVSWLSRPYFWGVLSMLLGVLVTFPGCPGHVPGVPRPPTLLTMLTLAFPDSRRTGWSSTPCGTSEATAVPSAAAPTATAGGSASPSWATTPTPTATRAGGSSAGSSCPATGGSRGCWAGCSPLPRSTRRLGAAPRPPGTSSPIRMSPDVAYARVVTCLIAGEMPCGHRLSPRHPALLPRGWGRPRSSASSPR